jgi:hypothetical protein
MKQCRLCQSMDHEEGGHFVEAFTNPVTREPYAVPEDLRTAATRICRAYGIKGICDPMYVANVIANETGRGDGCSNFFEAAPR